MFKNVSGQKLTVFAFDATTGLPKTGDAANLTAYVSKDGGTVTVLGDTSATEYDATNAKGYYDFDVAQAESNADKCHFTAKSSTANVVVIAVPAVVYTFPPTFTALAISSGAVTAGTVSDKTGYALSTAGAGAVWDVTQGLHTTSGTTGKTLSDTLAQAGAANTNAGNAAISASAAEGYAAGASDDTAAIRTVTDSLTLPLAQQSSLDNVLTGIDALSLTLADTQSAVGTAGSIVADMNTRLPSSLSADGYMQSNVQAFGGTAGTFNTGRPEVIAASVTGNVGGNVTGSIGSLATQAKSDVVDQVVNAIDGSYGEAIDNTDLKVGDIWSKVDVVLSTRLAASDYTAAPTASQNATAVAAQTNIAAGLTNIATNLDAKVSEAGGSGGTVIPVNQVPVPASRTWILKHVGSELQGELPLVRHTGENNVFAVDYRNDLSANGRIVSLDDITILSGPTNGITITSTGDDGGVDRNQSKFRIAIATVGVYVIQVTSTYSDHDGSGEAIGIVTLIVT